MKSDLDNKLVAVVRVRGKIGVRKTINETLSRLNVPRVNSAALLFGNASNLGMIKKCNDFVTFGAINAHTLEQLLVKKGAKPSKADLDALASGSKKAKEMLNLPIRLKPPKHGWEDTKLSFSNVGSLGYKGEAINALLSRMV